MDFNTFLSANTSRGFISLFPSFLKGKNQYIIKGGPGTGKSTMLKNIGNYGNSKEYTLEFFRCSSDPKSLDGVYVKEKNCAVCDGTSPHVLEPDFAGAMGGIINLSGCWNESFLKKEKEKIISIKSEISDCYKEAYTFISALGKMCETDRKRATLKADKSGEEAVLKFCSKHFKKKKNAKKGTSELRYLSTFSSEGFTILTDTVKDFSDKVFSLPYDFGYGDYLIEKIGVFAEEKGYDTYKFFDPLFPDNFSQIYIPELKIFVVSFNAFSSKKDLITTEICPSSLTSLPDKIKETDAIEKGMYLLIKNDLKTAKELHDKLEKIYIESMNFDEVGKVTADLMTKVFRN